MRQVMRNSKIVNTILQLVWSRSIISSMFIQHALTLCWLRQNKVRKVSVTRLCSLM